MDQYDLPNLRDVDQLAAAWRVSRHTVISWVRKGRLRPLRICRRLLFAPAECERFLREAEAKPEPKR